jgi:hypothetical protein
MYLTNGWRWYATDYDINLEPFTQKNILPHVCKNKIEKVKSPRVKVKRFRGNSKWQIEQGMGKNKTGKNV